MNDAHKGALTRRALEKYLRELGASRTEAARAVLALRPETCEQVLPTHRRIALAIQLRTIK